MDIPDTESVRKRERRQKMNKILIVDDEEAISNLLRMNLVKAGYQCETASDGEEAADAIYRCLGR